MTLEINTFEDIFEIVSKLDKGSRQKLYVGFNGTEVAIIRTDNLCPGDFKVVLKPPRKPEFPPTHLRLLIDLYLKKISDEQKARPVFLAFERIHKGERISKVVKELRSQNLTFSMELDPSDITVFYGALLLAEQEWNYGPRGCRKTRFDTARELLMRFIRWVAKCDYGDIDEIITSAVLITHGSGYEKSKVLRTIEKYKDQLNEGG